MTVTIVDGPRPVTGGVDTHLDLNVAAALDGIGGLLGVESFPTSKTIIDHIGNLAGNSAPGGQRQQAKALDDGLRALADLDRAISHAAQRPHLQLADPARTRLHHAGLRGSEMRHQHTLHEHLEPTAAPSIGMPM